MVNTITKNVSIRIGIFLPSVKFLSKELHVKCQKMFCRDEITLFGNFALARFLYNCYPLIFRYGKFDFITCFTHALTFAIVIT